MTPIKTEQALKTFLKLREVLNELIDLAQKNPVQPSIENPRDMRTKPEIKIIVGHEPGRQGELPFMYQVGTGGITRIEASFFSEQPFCETRLFNVYKGGHIYSTVTWRAVSEIFYEGPENR